MDVRRPTPEHLSELTRDQLTTRWYKYETFGGDTRWSCAVCFRTIGSADFNRLRSDPCSGYRCGHLATNELARRRARARKHKDEKQTRLF